MLSFLLRRLANYAVLTFVATCGGYLLIGSLLNPAARYLGRNPPLPQSSIDVILDQANANPSTPIMERLWVWLTRLAHGSLGQTVSGQSVVEQLMVRAGISLRLLIAGALIGALLGVIVGVWGAVRQYKASDQIMTYASFAIQATPVFVIAVLLMVLATKLNAAAGHTVIAFTGEYTPGLSGGFWAKLGDQLVHLVLPTISLALASIATYSRYQRSAMLDVLSADYIRTARAKGRTRRSALVRHGVRTALIPMSTYFAYSFTLLLTGAIVTERIYSWHGMGEFFMNGIIEQDINAVAGTILFTAILVLIASTLADVLYAALDPRVRV